MERIVRHITEKLTAQLPRFREWYTPDDLQVLDIPSFITERVILDMHQNLNESVTLPETEWADMEADSVRYAWMNFLEAIKTEVRMPESNASSMLETAVSDSLELATQPRKSIPEILFDKDDTLTVEELKKRIRYVTVGRALAAALIRYMEKKSKKTLTLDSCKKIVARIDDKLVESFTPLDWAKELEPLFVLAGPSVDTELFRIFFEDKKLKKYSSLFVHLNKSLNRTEFIDFMSSASQDMQIDETKKPSNVQKKAMKKSDRPKKSVNKPDAEDDEKKYSGEEFIPDDSILSSFQKRRVDSIFEEDDMESELTGDYDETEDETPLNSKFELDQDEPDTPDESDNQGDTIYKEMNLKKSAEEMPGKFREEEKGEDPEKMEQDLLSKWKAIAGEEDSDETEIDDLSETEKPRGKNEAGVESVDLYNETEDEEDIPIWRAFLEREDLDSFVEDEGQEETESKNRKRKDGKEELADRLTDQFFGSYDTDEQGGEQDSNHLLRWLADEKNRFVENIFSGSERAFDEAIEDIASFDDWKHAAKYIKEEVYNRNRIDIFDEVAVDFTDRLHTFFIENKS